MAIVDEGDGIISFHGKKYSTVKRRVDAFRADCPIHRGWAIHTTAVETEKLVTFRAEIVAPDGRVVATGHKRDFRNADAVYEKCETGAIGRALGAAGYEEGENLASAEDIERWADVSWTPMEQAQFWQALAAMSIRWETFDHYMSQNEYPMPWNIDPDRRSALLKHLDEAGIGDGDRAN